MKLQFILPFALLSCNTASAELSRKREAATPESLGKEQSVPITQLKLTEEEELFLRYLQEDSSHSFSLSGPTASPSHSPSASPSAKPSPSPSKSPTRAPIIGTRSPTKAPVGDSPGVCKDSGCAVERIADFSGRKLQAAVGSITTRSCKWVGRKNTTKRCSYKYMTSHCPDTCGTCSLYQCSDSLATFYLWQSDKETCASLAALTDVKIEKFCRYKTVAGKCPVTCGACSKSDKDCADSDKEFRLKTKKRTCTHVANKPKLCNKNGVAATCRKTCGYSNTELGISC
ncbi:predicted protein [Chaetoceros tenuissimus]|uniref:ShKT domain-containing protein n=1 Tax=Chaetoceros tenuissimus TaxID=426638 RepID=A0AAD3CV29_9STRA|nr:predicted protein [Chaetoceros tenuissimus]